MLPVQQFSLGSLLERSPSLTEEIIQSAWASVCSSTQPGFQAWHRKKVTLCRVSQHCRCRQPHELEELHLCPAQQPDGLLRLQHVALLSREPILLSFQVEDLQS